MKIFAFKCAMKEQGIIVWQLNKSKGIEKHNYNYIILYVKKGVPISVF